MVKVCSERQHSCSSQQSQGAREVRDSIWPNPAITQCRIMDARPRHGVSDFRIQPAFQPLSISAIQHFSHSALQPLSISTSQQFSIAKGHSTSLNLQYAARLGHAWVSSLLRPLTWVSKSADSNQNRGKSSSAGRVDRQLSKAREVSGQFRSPPNQFSGQSRSPPRQFSRQFRSPPRQFSRRFRSPPRQHPYERNAQN